MSQVAYEVVNNTILLVEKRVNKSTVAVLEELLARAREGKIQGLALIEFDGARDYVFHVVGSVENRPTFVLGAIAKFKHDISEQIGG